MKKKIVVSSLALILSLGTAYFFYVQPTFHKPNLFLQNSNAVAYDDWLIDYDELLQSVVILSDSSGELQSLVKYSEIKENASYKLALDKLDRVFLPKDVSRQTKLSAWINFYNFLVIKMVVEHPKITMMSDLNSSLTSVWGKEAGRINGVATSLNLIEHEIIRKEFDEAKIHFALNCGAMSCPNLLNRAYTPQKLESQLEKQKTDFLLNRSKGMMIDLEKREIHLSPIFKWFDIDFKPDPVRWLRDHGIISDDEINFKLKYLEYNWKLNKN